MVNYDIILSRTAEATDGKSGREFLYSLCYTLMETMEAPYVHIASVSSNQPDEAVIYCACYRGHFIDNTEFRIQGSPSEKTLRRDFLLIKEKLGTEYRKPFLPEGFQPESYIGVAIPGDGKQPAGIIEFFYDRPLHNIPPTLRSHMLFIAGRSAHAIMRSDTLMYSSSILDSLSEYVAVIDSAGFISISNRSWKKLALGKKGSLIIGASIGENYLDLLENITHEADDALSLLYDALKNILHGTGDFFSVDLSIDDSVNIKYYSVTVTLLSESNAAIIVFSDITEQYNAQESLEKSEEKNRSLLEGIPDMIFRIDLKGTFLEFKPGKGTTPFVGPDLFIGKTILEVLPEKTAQLLIEKLHEVSETGETRVVEYSLPQNGVSRYYEARILYIKEDEFLAITRDITIKKQAELTISQLATVVEQASSSVIITDLEGTIEYVNPYFCKTTGYSYTETVGKNPRMFKSGAQDDSIYREMWKTITSGNTWNGIFINRIKDGSLIHEEINIFPVRDSSGEIVKFASVKSNITDRIKTEERIRKQNTFFNTIIESFSNPFYVIDTETYSILIANDAAHSMLQNNSYTCYELIHGRDTPCSSTESLCPLEIVKRTKKPVTVEHLHHDSNGEPVYIELHGYPIFDESGNIVQMIEHSHNITERKKTEIELKKLFMAVEQSLNIVMITDKDGIIEYVNPTFTEITGYSKEEVIGRNASSFSNLDMEEGEKLRESLNKYDKWIGEYRNTKKDGRTYWEYTSISSIRNESNEITHYIRDAIDITRKKQQEKQLEEAKENAEKANHIKSTFLAHMSHEIRTPMNSITGFINMIESSGLTKTQMEYIRYVQISVESLLQIINDILDFSKLESKKLHLDRHPFDPIREFEKEIEIFQSMAVDRKVHLMSYITPSLPTEIISDSLRIRQVIGNLISNSIKFTPEGGDIIVEIELMELSVDKCRLYFSVSDTGIGISESEKSRIFNAFQQADASTTRNFGGTGLGLSICQSLVSLFGGKLNFKSETNCGSRFFFDIEVKISKHHDDQERQNTAGGKIAILTGSKIPTFQELIIIKYLLFLDPDFILVSNPKEISPDLNNCIFLYVLSKQHPIEEVMDAVKGNSLVLISSYEYLDIIKSGEDRISSVIFEPFTMGKLANSLKEIEQGQVYKESPFPDRQVQPISFRGRILIAEDNELNQKLLSLLLKERGLIYEITSNGQDAVDSFEKNRYDIIFMDINMPVKDGINALKDILGIEKTRGDKHMPVVALTAKAIKGDSEQLLEKGFDEYLSKPIDTDKLDRILEKYLPHPAASVQTSPKQTDGIQIHAEATAKALGIDIDTVNELIDEFFENARSYLSSLEKAIAEEDREMIISLAHKFRGIAANLRFSKISSDLQIIEERARNNTDVNYAELLRHIREELPGKNSA